MNQFFITRHGETIWNVQGRTQGIKNSDLTQKGILQAQKLAENLINFNIDYIFSSDLKRAYDTANIIAKKIKKDVVKEEKIREFNFGKWEGLTLKEIEENYSEEFKKWRKKPSEANIEDGESLLMAKNRVRNFLDELDNKYENKNILIVSHGIIVKTLILSVLETSLDNMYKIKQDNTALNVIKSLKLGYQITLLNDTSHLKGI